MTTSNATLSSPLSFTGEVSPSSVGMSLSGVRRINETFDQMLADGLHPGAQLVVLRHGQVVVDRAAGWANIARKVPVTPDTPFNSYSITKPFTGMCIHRLVEDGKLELEAPIARYWPEWGCKGKEKATIRQVFSHQAGLSLSGLNVEMLLWWNWNLLVRYLARLKAEFEPGTKSAYHLVNYGFILGEVVRRVSGQRIDVFMRQKIFEPLGLKNSYLGLPRRELKRAARIYCGTPKQRIPAHAFNVPYIRGAVIPAASLNSTARDIAIFYQMMLNKGLYAGQQIFQPDTIATATSLSYEGWDTLFDAPVRWAYGFQLGGNISGKPDEPQGMGKKSTIRTFGHFGQASCMSWADPDADVAVAFTCNRLLDDEQVMTRWQSISDAVWEAIE
jgi:CubicO group peptidase (beta-lactamase class C family)